MATSKKRIVLKFGTGILTKTKGNGLDTKQLARLSADVAELCHAGYECIVVSSGSVGAGMMLLGLDKRPSDLPGKQACAAVGQSRLMRLYETQFSKHKLKVAQLLLTHSDLDSKIRHLNAHNTLERLFECGDVVPIINENDTVAVEELNFGDNDSLSAEVAMMADADLLVVLTSVDGLLRNRDGKSVLVREVKDVKSVMEFVTDDIGKHSTGGMGAKLKAIGKAIHAGIPAVIANGLREGVIERVVAGKKEGTRFGFK